MLRLKNLADAALASVSILRNSRWRPKWQHYIWFGQNIATSFIQCVFQIRIYSDIALFINTRGDGKQARAKIIKKKIKNASKLAAKSNFYDKILILCNCHNFFLIK